MTINSTPKATEFAKVICSDLKITEGLDEIQSDAIDDLQGTYGDFERGFGDEEFGSVHVYAHGKFSHWFDKHLSEQQKKRLLELSEKEDLFEITSHSTRRRNLVLSFLIKLKRTNVDEFTHLSISIDFPDIDTNKHTIYGEMFDSVSEDEISKMMMLYELKR